MHLEADGLGRRFGRKRALDGLNFSCGPGEIVALIGNNGAGKTTLLQLLGGLLVPTSGSLRIDGSERDRRDEAFRRRVGIIPDFPPFFAHHTVLEHIAMVGRLHDAGDTAWEERVLEAMEAIGILELGRQQLGELSRGQIFKTVFVALLAVRPRLWLLDEPMASGMDPRGLGVLRERLRAEAQEGATVFYSTQLAEVAERFSDQVFVLAGGRLTDHGPAATLLARHGASTLEDALGKLLGSGPE